MAKSPFADVSSKELANQVAARKRSLKKLPTWFKTPLIYYPPLISIEQCSSEITAKYKAELAVGTTLIDLTGGFGVDSLFFAHKMASVTHCEISTELSLIAEHNAQVLNKVNLTFKNEDGIEFLKDTDQWGTIYIDPSRRSDVGKVFMLKDCLPNVVEHMNLMLDKAGRIIIKTSPLLDITAGLKELPNVSEVHIISTKNECKELLFIIDKVPSAKTKIISSAINESLKQFSFYKDSPQSSSVKNNMELEKYLYEPDVALLKSGAFDLIAEAYNLQKLNNNTQLYTADRIKEEFPGRIFTIDQTISVGDLKKEKELTGNVIVRSFPQKAEALVKKYKIKPNHTKFLIFTQYKTDTYIVIKATIIQHY
jgi:16S rRNA G966 N2-methylase RsmD